ncbi:MAG TPA: hypothetical protein VGH69_19895, partial [Mycobacterium sp.]
MLTALATALELSWGSKAFANSSVSSARPSDAARSITENPTAVLIFTAVFVALAVSVLGLAVPVTASFVISWVIIGPA